MYKNVLLIVLLVFQGNSFATNDGDIAAALELFFERAAAFGFSGSVLVSREGKVLLSEGYGFSNRQKGIYANPQTAYSVASITKPFTAAAILKLEQQNKLKVTDSITKYFPSVPSDKTSITIHLLLNHQSGLDDLYAGNGVTDRSEAVRKILANPLIAKPGERYSYSNDGYGLLAAIIEIVSGKSYAKFLRQELFEPAGMTRTGFFGEKIWNADSVAHGYNMETDNGSPADYRDHWGDRGSGDLITTVEDLHRWEIALREKKILPEEIQQKMYGSYAKMPNGWHYGYGWMTLMTDRGTRELYHGGGDVPRGYTAAFQRYTEEGFTTIVLVNSMMDEIGLRNAVRDPLEAILFGGDVALPPVINPIRFDPSKFEGVYALPDGAQFSIKEVHGQLVAKPEGQEAIGMLVGYKAELKDTLTKWSETLTSALEKLRTKSGANEFNEDPWKDFLENRKTSLEKFEIIGTWPISTDRRIFTTYARIYFAGEKPEVFRWVWNEGKLTMILNGTDAPPAPLAAMTPMKFVTYHLLMKTSSHLSFDKAGSLTLSSNYGTAVARRIK